MFYGGWWLLCFCCLIVVVFVVMFINVFIFIELLICECLVLLCLV